MASLKEFFGKKKETKHEFNDTFTEEVLKEYYYMHIKHVKGLKEVIAKTGHSVRLPNFPEHISENIVKHILHNHPGEYKDTSSKWTKGDPSSKLKLTGDLYSDKEKVQECKCISSDGPPSFGPTEMWNVIYFLDATQYLENKFILYRIPLANDSAEWKAIKMNKGKGETYEDKCKGKVRPRLNFQSIKEQLGEHCKKIFEGTFEDIFTQSET